VSRDCDKNTGIPVLVKERDAQLRLARITLHFLLLACLAVATQRPAHAETFHRIVSLNVCADQYLLALADPSQIAALTIFAQDRSISFLADKAGAFMTVPSAAEAIIKLDPDLIIGSRFRDTDTKAMLRRLGYKVVEIKRANSAPEMIEQTRRVGKLLGKPERARELIGEIEKAASAPPLRGDAPSALVYQRRGYVSGSKSIISHVMRYAGLRNEAEKLGRSSISRISLEELAVARPDFLILDTEALGKGDIGSEVLHHPVLDRLFRKEQVIRMPSSLTVCGGPSFPAAVDFLRHAVSRIRTKGG
jgi:iron complex transport system substrate-binding protein